MYTKMTAYERFMSLHPATAATHRVTEFGRHIARAPRMLRDGGFNRQQTETVTSWRTRDTSRRSRG